MKTILFFALWTLASAALAGQVVVMTPQSFQVIAPDVLSKLEDSLKYPEGILKRYKPTGARISQKEVSQNQINFVATKSVLFISKSVFVSSVLEMQDNDKSCAPGEKGYRLSLSFDGSDRLVTDNIDHLEADLCVRVESGKKMNGVVKPKILLGKDYSSTLGPIAVNLIKDQVTPLIESLTEEIKSMRSI